MWNVDMKQ